MNDIFIEDYIPAGYENRISRGSLVQRTGFSDRKNRALIEDARERGVMVYASSDGGYFQYKDKMDDPFVRAYMIAENNRFKTMSHKNKLMRQAWAAIHSEDSKGQFPGQLSLF